MNTATNAVPAATAKPTPAPAAAPRNKNWFMASTRKWHIWLGVAIALFLSFLCLSGILLAHKDIFKPYLDQPLYTINIPAKDFAPLTEDERKLLKSLKERERKEREYEKRMKKEAMLAAGMAQPQHDEHKEKGHGPDREKKRSPEKGMKDDDHEEDEKKVATVWKVMKDLHTGKFLDSNWMYFNDMVAFIGIFLCCSGVYLWAAAKIKQAENARKAKAAAAAKASALNGAPSKPSPTASTPALARGTVPAPVSTSITSPAGAAGE